MLDLAESQQASCKRVWGLGVLGFSVISGLRPLILGSRVYLDPEQPTLL